MAKEVVDTRKLKDEVAEYLKKSKFEKAADVLEKLVKAEPKDMSHRLKLGDTYRRMDQITKSIGAYQYAAKFFGDEGQLIKAIGAVKIILEIDPKNEDAQQQLADMNQRRFGKPTLADVGMKAPAKAIGAGARATSALELAEGEAAVAGVGAALTPELPVGDDEPLELDDGKPSRRPAPQRPAAIVPGPPPRAVVPPPAEKKVYDLGSPDDELDLMTGANVSPTPPRAPPKPPVLAPPPPPPEELDLDMDLGGGTEKLPDEAILTPQAEDLAVPESDEITLDEDMTPAPSAAPKAVPPPPPLPKKPAAPSVTISDEIAIEEEAPPAKKPAAKGAAVPIADLLSSESEEEIELLSITSDEEAAGPRPMANKKAPTPDEMDLDAAFGKIAPETAEKPKIAPKKVPLFDDLSQEAFVELVNKLSYHRHVPGQLIIKEGDPGRSFYVIVEGKVRIYKNGPDGAEITLAHLGEGAFFGEMALLSGAPRTANVVAEEETEILEVTDTVLRELAQNHPQVVQSLKNFYRQRLLNNVMAISPLFKDFDPSERKAIVEKFRMKQAAAGEVLITEGKNSDGLYVVLHGSVDVRTKKGAEPVDLARLKEGEIFGEMSLLTRKPATATVSAPMQAILLRLPRENFQELVLTHPQILELVSELTEKRKAATEAVLQGQGPGHDGMSFV